MKRKSIIQVFSIYAALIFVLLTSGCVGPTVWTYEGDRLPKSEVAVIKGGFYYYLLAHRTYIYRIDDSYPEATKVSVLPGRHELVIKYVEYGLLGNDTSSRCVREAFNFEAGHEYKIKYLYEGIFREGVKIIDVTTGAIIFSQPWSMCGSGI